MGASANLLAARAENRAVARMRVEIAPLVNRIKALEKLLSDHGIKPPESE